MVAFGRPERETSMKGFDDLKEKLDAERNTNSSSSGEEQDYEDLPAVKMTARSAIAGTLVGVGFAGDTSAPDNIHGPNSGDFVFTLENPTTLLGETWEALGREEAEDGLIANLDGDAYYPFDVDRLPGRPTRDYRVVDPDGRNVKAMTKQLGNDWEQVGVEIYGTEFPGGQVDDIDEETVEIFSGSAAGRLMMQSVDISQGKSAYITDDNEKTKGLIEFPPTYGSDEYDPSEDERERCATQPTLHPELAGEEVVIFLDYGDEYRGNRQVFGHLLWNNTDTPVAEMDDISELAGSDLVGSGDPSFEPRMDLRDDREVYLTYHEPDGGWSALGDADVTADTDTDTDARRGDGSGSGSGSGGSESESGLKFDELDSDSDSTTDDTTSFGETVTMDSVGPDTREFVSGVASYMGQKGADTPDDAFDLDFASVVENAREKGEVNTDDDVDTIRTLAEREGAE